MMKADASHKHRFYAELGKLLDAGFGIRQAADVMTGSGLPAAEAALLTEMQAGLAQGKSIADSLGSDRVKFSDMERGILAAGERGGRLATSMHHLAGYFGMLASTRREALRSLIHPVIVLHLGALIGSVPVTMLGSGNGVSQMISGFVTTLLVIYAVAFIAFIAIRALFRKARHDAATDRAIRRIPLLGKTRENIAMAGFCKVYHTCLLAGIPMRETVRMATDASHSGTIREAGQRLERVLDTGGPLGPAMASDASFPASFSRSYTTGEAAGTLDTDLANWSNHFRNEAESGARTLATVVPKLLYFIMLGYVAWKIAGFYGGYYDGLFKEME